MQKILLAIRILLTYRNGYLFFLEKLRIIRKGRVTYVTWRGMKYTCRVGSTDFAILNETTIFKDYVTPEFSKLNENSLVLDFGGQAGDFAIYAAFHQGCEVWTFEPDQENFELIEENILQNKLGDKVKAFRQAVNNEGGDLTFYLSDHSNKGPNKITVPAISINEILERLGNRNIDYLKIDIEGGEHEIIIPENHEFFDRVRFLIMEYHDMPHVENAQPVGDLEEKLHDLDFINVSREGEDHIGILKASK